MLKKLHCFIFLLFLAKPLLAFKRHPPLNLLQNEYKRANKLLVIGAANHSTVRVYELLVQLLDRIGRDKNLKYIALERPYDQNRLYNQSTTSEVSKAISSQKYSDELLKAAICSSGEWAYSLSVFLSHIYRINQKRPHNPIKVMAVDGLHSFGENMYNPAWPKFNGTLEDIEQSQCQLQELTLGNYPFYYRERDSSHNFTTQVYEQLRKGEKAIVLYNYSHILPGFKSCLPIYNEYKKVWVAKMVDRNWFSIFLRDNTGARELSRIVAIDEVGGINPRGIFKFLQNSGEQKDFGVETHALDLKEVGVSVLDSLAFLSATYLTSYGRLKVPEMVDSVIKLHHTIQNNWAYPPHLYFPSFCD